MLIATQNPGKVAEMRRLLHILAEELDVPLLSLNEFAEIEAPEETGSTFMENAELKARYYADALGKITIADDSGLVVDALGGDPGVMSARYGGPGLDDAARTRLLLDNMREVPDDQRTARFVCAVYVSIGPTEMLNAEGIVEGNITREPLGSNGFGYDPVFVPLGHTRTTAEMSADAKDALSHRGRAVRGIRPDLLDVMRQI